VTHIIGCPQRQLALGLGPALQTGGLARAWLELWPLWQVCEVDGLATSLAHTARACLGCSRSLGCVCCALEAPGAGALPRRSAAVEGAARQLLQPCCGLACCCLWHGAPSKLACITWPEPNNGLLILSYMDGISNANAATISAAASDKLHCDTVAAQQRATPDLVNRFTEMCSDRLNSSPWCPAAA
jgi:hypothetical protein